MVKELERLPTLIPPAVILPHSPSGVRSAAGLPLLHADAYYTLNEIPRAK